MGDYPNKATTRVHVDQSSDIPAMMRADAAGQLPYTSGYVDIYPGELWTDLCAAEPAFTPRVIAAAGALLRDADVRCRDFALCILLQLRDATIPKLLREAFEAKPDDFVGVPSPTQSAPTLFASWLQSLSANAFKDQTEFRRAAALAKPYLDLPEAGTYDYVLPMTLGESFDSWLPDVVKRSSDEKVDGMLYSISPKDVPVAAAALAKSSLADRQRFAASAKRYLAERAPTNTALAHEVDRRLGLTP